MISVPVLFVLIPDQVQPRVFNEQFSAKLPENATIVVASGYNVFFKLLEFKPSQNVVMVAPRSAQRSRTTNELTSTSRMIGSSVRSLYTKGKGFPCFVSVEQDGTGNGLAIALALSRAIGATKAGAIASSVREEVAMDLFAEQALWPNIIVLFKYKTHLFEMALRLTCVFREAFSVLKEAGCSDEALCYEMCVESFSSVIVCDTVMMRRWMSKEPAEIFERAAEEGFIEQVRFPSKSPCMCQC